MCFSSTVHRAIITTTRRDIPDIIHSLKAPLKKLFQQGSKLSAPIAGSEEYESLFAVEKSLLELQIRTL